MSSDSSREVDFHFDLNRHLTVTNGNASYPVPAAGMLLCSVGRMQKLSGSVSLLLVHDLFFYFTTFLSLNDRILTPRLQKLRNQPFFFPLYNPREALQCLCESVNVWFINFCQGFTLHLFNCKTCTCSTSCRKDKNEKEKRWSSSICRSIPERITFNWGMDFSGFVFTDTYWRPEKLSGLYCYLCKYCKWFALKSHGGLTVLSLLGFYDCMDTFYDCGLKVIKSHPKWLQQQSTLRRFYILAFGEIAGTDADCFCLLSLIYGWFWGINLMIRCNDLKGVFSFSKYQKQ